MVYLLLFLVLAGVVVPVGIAGRAIGGAVGGALTGGLAFGPLGALGVGAVGAYIGYECGDDIYNVSKMVFSRG